MPRLLFAVIAAVIVVFGIAIVLYTFFWMPERESRQSGQIRIASTIFPLFDIVENIGGERVKGVLIIPPGASHETFSISPETVRKLSGARVIFTIGAGLDNWIHKGAEGSGARVVEVSDGIKLREFPGGGVDPHYWLSFDNAMQIARNIARELALIDPSNAEEYALNLSSYLARLSDSKIETELELAPFRGRSIAVFHDAWFYFADAYGLNIAATFEAFPGKEPTAQYLAEFIQAIREHSLKVIFREPQLSEASLLQIARDMNVKIGVLDPIGGIDGDTDSYISLMQYNVNAVAGAMRE